MHNTQSTKVLKERVLLVIVDFKKRKKSAWSSADILVEMEELVGACGGEVVDNIICKIDKPSANNLIGDGQVQAIVGLCGIRSIDTIIFSYDLKGSQQRNLEKQIEIKIIDRTQLILDIFARHATTKEGKMQVELAQLAYMLPRLVGKGVELSRLGGGIGTIGPGETKLEVDRRTIKHKISNLKRALEEVEYNRGLERRKRKNKGVPTASLVGYTNAGKSTLLNTLTDAGQKTRDGLFTTLSSKARQLILPNNQRVVLSDTVGFMRELPHNLIESFKATLEEVVVSDFLIHVIDVTNPSFKDLYDSVLVVLDELKVVDKPSIIVLNKTDNFEDKDWLEGIRKKFDNAVCISARNGENIESLLEAIEAQTASLVTEINITIPINRMDLINLAHKEGEVYSVKYYEKTINLRALVPTYLVGKFK